MGSLLELYWGLLMNRWDMTQWDGKEVADLLFRFPSILISPFLDKRLSGWTVKRQTVKTESLVMLTLSASKSLLRSKLIKLCSTWSKFQEIESKEPFFTLWSTPSRAKIYQSRLSSQLLQLRVKPPNLIGDSKEYNTTKRKASNN